MSMTTITTETDDGQPIVSVILEHPVPHTDDAVRTFGIHLGLLAVEFHKHGGDLADCLLKPKHTDGEQLWVMVGARR